MPRLISQSSSDFPYLDVMWSHSEFIGGITSEKCIVVITPDVIDLQNWVIGGSQEVWSMQSLRFIQILAAVSMPMANFLQRIIGFSFEVPREFNFGHARGPTSQKTGGAPRKGQFGKLGPPIDNGRICKQFQDKTKLQLCLETKEIFKYMYFSNKRQFS